MYLFVMLDFVWANNLYLFYNYVHFSPSVDTFQDSKHSPQILSSSSLNQKLHII